MTEHPESFSDPLRDAPRVPTPLPASLRPPTPPPSRRSSPVPVITPGSNERDILHAIYLESRKTSKSTQTCATILIFCLILFLLFGFVVIAPML